MRVFNIKSFALTFLLSISIHSFAAPIGSEDTEHSDKPKPKCELLLVEAAKLSANPELNYQLQTQLRSEVFVRSVQEKVDKVSPLKSQLLYLNSYFENSKALSERVARVVNKSIVGFERHGFKSVEYVEKGLSEEDGVIYKIHHPEGKSSYIVLSRGGDTLEGEFDLDVFASGDLKVGSLPGKTDDLSAISIEVYTEEENGMMKGSHFTTLPSSVIILKAHDFMDQQKELWNDWFSGRVKFATEEMGVQKLEPHSWGIDFLKDVSEDGAEEP